MICWWLLKFLVISHWMKGNAVSNWGASSGPWQMAVSAPKPLLLHGCLGYQLLSNLFKWKLSQVALDPGSCSSSDPVHRCLHGQPWIEEKVQSSLTGSYSWTKLSGLTSQKSCLFLKQHSSFPSKNLFFRSFIAVKCMNHKEFWWISFLS